MNKTVNERNVNIQKKRRLKFGAFAVALTVAVVALVVIVNVVFTALAEKNLWYIDMTERDLYTPNQGAVTLLEEYQGIEDFNVSFIFCVPKDQLQSNQLVDMVHKQVLRYAELFDFISVEYVDIINDPQALDKYQFNSVSKPKTTSVIVANGNNAILYAIDTFFVSDGEGGSIYAFRGDYTIASAVIRLSGDNPIAYFVTNHNEKVKGTALRQLFVDAGYDVRDIDLSKEEPDYENAQVIVVNNPSYDFFGPDDSVNEIKKLERFLDSNGGLMVFMDETFNPTPNLDALLAEWGVKFERQFLRDYENCLAGSNGAEIVADYVKTGTGASLTAPLRGLETPPKAVANKAIPITALYDGEVGKYFAGKGTRYCNPILTTSVSKSAVATPLEGEGEGVKGVYNLMTVTVDDRYKDNVPQRSYVLAAGTSSFSDNKYLEKNNYANRDLIFNVMKQFARKTAPVDIDAKVFSDTSLTITSRQANMWTGICTLLLPAIVSGVGIYVYVRRRYL